MISATPDKPTDKAKQNDVKHAWLTPRLTVEQQIMPQDLVSRVMSFLRAHAVFLFVGLVACMGGDGSVIWGFFLPFFFLSVKIICQSWELGLGDGEETDLKNEKIEVWEQA